MMLRILIGCLALVMTAHLAAAHVVKRQPVSKSRAAYACETWQDGSYSRTAATTKASQLPYRRQGSNPDFPMLFKGM